MIDLEAHENWCLSGGADGADLAWGTAASASGHGVIHFSFNGHNSSAPAETLVNLGPEALAKADEYCLRANTMIQRRYPPKSIKIRRLLQRNWYQVETTDSLYAISSFDKNGTVEGGTAWAVAMFIQRHDGAACAAYVFDQIACRWYQWEGSWKPIYEPPKPRGLWTGIGRRDLTSIGRLAINVLLDYRPAAKTIWA